MKKALFTQVNDGVTYERGKVYADEVVAHLPASDFEDTNEVAETVEVIAPVVDTTNDAPVATLITEQDLIDHPEYTQAGLTVGDAKPPVDDNKGDGVEVLQ